MKNFYKNLNKPFFALAPLAGITDSAFRQMCKEFGADVVYSEMASANALAFQPDKTLAMFEFSEIERPYAVQLFGSEPKHFAVAAKIISSAKRSDRSRSGRTAFSTPDGIDINFGCPVPKVVKQGAGIALFRDLKRSREVIRAVIDSTGLPVSIKTRSRVGEIDVLKFLDHMKGLDIKAIMIHGRSDRQGFSGPVDTGIIRKARDYFGGVIIANGGVELQNAPHASTLGPSPALRERGTYVNWLLGETKADGVAIGQGAMGRPWIFQKIVDHKTQITDSMSIYNIALEHSKLAEKIKGKQGILEMRKHLCWYVRGLDGARELRRELVKVESIDDIEKIFSFHNSFSRNPEFGTHNS